MNFSDGAPSPVLSGKPSHLNEGNRKGFQVWEDREAAAHEKSKCAIMDSVVHTLLSWQQNWVKEETQEQKKVLHIQEWSLTWTQDSNVSSFSTSSVTFSVNTLKHQNIQVIYLFTNKLDFLWEENYLSPPYELSSTWLVLGPVTRALPPLMTQDCGKIFSLICMDRKTVKF